MAASWSRSRYIAAHRASRIHEAVSRINNIVPFDMLLMPRQKILLWQTSRMHPGHATIVYHSLCITSHQIVFPSYQDAQAIANLASIERQSAGRSTTAIKVTGAMLLSPGLLEAPAATACRIRLRVPILIGLGDGGAVVLRTLRAPTRASVQAWW